MGFVVAGHATPANQSDCKELMAVVRACGLEHGEPVFADKGYSGQEYSQQLEKAGYCDGIMYKAAHNRPLPRPSVWSTRPSAASGARWSGPSGP